MNTRNLLLLLGFITTLSAGCSKSDSGPGNNNKTVKYEVAGTYTGKFTVIYTDNVSGTTTVNDVTAPWTKEISYGKDVIAVALAAGNTTYGTPGQTAFLRIYVNGKQEKQSNATAGSGGELTLPAIGHNF